MARSKIEISRHLIVKTAKSRVPAPLSCAPGQSEYGGRAENAIMRRASGLSGAADAQCHGA